MCLTIPGKILSIKDGIAEVKSSRETAQIDLAFVVGAKAGDWILYATNRAVKIISESDAKEIISLLQDNYSPVDVSKLSFKFKKIIYKVRTGNSDLNKEDIEYLLRLKGKEDIETLYAEANTLRKERIDDFVCIHGIIEFSNYCCNNCLYCGIRKDSKVKRYRMEKKEIVETAKKAVDGEGYKLLVLQSGEDLSYSDDDLIEIIQEIKKEMKVFVFISVGERSAKFYKRARKAGASGSLMRFETSNKKLYREMRPGHEFETRVSSIKYQVSKGYYMASGSLIGLPGQTISDIADDLLMIKRLKVPMISAGPYVEAKGTPLQISNSLPANAPHQAMQAGKYQIPNKNSNDKFKNDQKNVKWSSTLRDEPSGSDSDEKMENGKLIELTLKYIAVARFLMPEVKIPVTTALETLDPENGRHRALLAGANALMFNLTPEKYAGKYNIYDNKYREREKVWQKYGLFKGEESYEMLEERLML